MHFRCGVCEKRLTLPDIWAGKETICPYCSSQVKVPEIVMASPAEPAPPMTFGRFLIGTFNLAVLLVLFLFLLLLGWACKVGA